MKKHIDRETLVRNFEFDPASGFFYRKLKSGKVSTKPAGSVEPEGYRNITFAYQSWPASHLVWLHTTGELPKNVVDHRNGVRDDNRFGNLRDTTHAINAQNRNGPNRCRLVDLPVGVYPRNAKFLAKFMVGGVCHRVGVFDTVEEAEKEYLEQRRILCPGNSL